MSNSITKRNSGHAILVTMTEFGDDYITRKSDYIFATMPYQSQSKFSIIICNNKKTYLNKDSLYISKYSNLPPMVVRGENANQICAKIEEKCSEFFARTRSGFIIEIADNKIGVGLRNARFGKHFRLFNKELTKEQTRQAIAEITDFLLYLKAVVEQD